MDNLRKLIRKTIIGMLSEQLGEDDPAAETEAGFVEKVDGLQKQMTIDIKNAQEEYKAKDQLKGKLDPTSPERKGLERSLPEMKKKIEDQKKKSIDLANTKKELEKLTADKEALQAQKQVDSTGKEVTQSVLPSLPSL